jgi:peptide-methionine (S)-S-oxide reductase
MTANNRSSEKNETATLAGGCFWCLEAVFERLKGVDKVTSGYSGGTISNPSYEQVSTGRTGHAEAVQIRFDSTEITFKELLEIFFSVHDPTTPDRQGPDVGSQYRSAIFYHSETQKVVAREVVSQLEAAGVWDSPLVTEIAPFEAFYPAEAYHQHYYDENPQAPYCRAIIAPKLSKVRQGFAERLKQAG